MHEPGFGDLFGPVIGNGLRIVLVIMQWLHRRGRVHAQRRGQDQTAIGLGTFGRGLVRPLARLCRAIGRRSATACWNRLGDDIPALGPDLFGYEFPNRGQNVLDLHIGYRI